MSFHVFSLKFNHGFGMVWASSPNSSGGAMWGPLIPNHVAPLPGDKWRFLKLDPKSSKITSHWNTWWLGLELEMFPSPRCFWDIFRDQLHPDGASKETALESTEAARSSNRTSEVKENEWSSELEHLTLPNISIPVDWNKVIQQLNKSAFNSWTILDCHCEPEQSSNK